MNKIKKYLLSYIKDDNKFKLIIFSIIFFSALLLWIVRLLIIFGENYNLHGSHIFIFNDYQIYYDAVSLYRNGEDFYNNTGYLYPPISIFFFLPFGYLPLGYSGVAFLLFNLILLFLTTFIILNILKHYNIYTSTVEKILLLISIFVFEPITKSLISGQVNILILFILTVSYYYIIIKNEKILSSICLTIGTVIKIYPIFLLIFEIFKKNVKGLTSKYATFMILVTSFSLIFFGIPTHRKFIATYMNFDKIKLYNASDLLLKQEAFNYNESVTNMVMKIISLFEPSQSSFDKFYVFWSILKIIFLVSILYYIYTISLNKNLQNLPEWEILIFSTLLILPIIITNVVWFYYGTFLATAYILFIFVFKLDLIQKYLLFLTLLLFSTQEYIVFLINKIGWPFTSIVYIVSPTTISFALFLFLVLYSFRKIKLHTSPNLNSASQSYINN